MEEEKFDITKENDLSLSEAEQLQEIVNGPGLDAKDV